MSENHVPYLCGGTLFYLLLNSRWPKSTPRERRGRVKDGLRDCNVINGLVYAVTGYDNPNPESTLRKDISSYRECGMDGSTNIPFHLENTYITFENNMRSDEKYQKILMRMHEFVEGYIDDEKSTMLVKRILCVIEADQIDDQVEFFIKDGITPITRAELLKQTEFELEPFLIGVMHFILKYRRVNTLGFETLEYWCPKEGNERNLIKKEIGDVVGRKAKVWNITIAGDMNNEPSMDDDAMTSQESAESQNDDIDDEPEVVDDGCDDGDEKNVKKVTVIKQQTNVIQNGENNLNFTNNGTINFNF